MKRLFLLVLLVTLQGCQPPICVYLYNTQNEPIVLTTYSSLGKHGFYQKNKTLKANRVFKKKGGFFLAGSFLLTTSTDTYCYQPKNLASVNWLDRDKRIVTVYTMLGEDNKVYIFDEKSFGKDDYFLDDIPAQPKGFPIEPISSDECRQYIESRS